MKNLKISQNAQDGKQKISHESRVDTQHIPETDASADIPGLVLNSSTDNQKISREDIELVQNLIERCLQLYMSRAEVVKTLLNRARIDPGFTALVWKKLEEENSDFFRAYYIRMKLKRQIILFNHLLERQYQLMKNPVPLRVPLVAEQHTIHHIPDNNPPLGYPIQQQHLMLVPGQPCHNSLDPHITGGVLAPRNFQAIQVNPENEAIESAASLPPCNASSPISEMATSPSAAPEGHFPFAIVTSGLDTSALNTAFIYDAANSEGLQLDIDVAGCSRDPLESLEHIPWNFSLSDVSADLANLEDLDALGNYAASLFLHSDSEIQLDSSEPDDMVDEYLADDITGSGPRSEDNKL